MYPKQLGIHIKLAWSWHAPHPAENAREGAFAPTP